MNIELNENEMKTIELLLMKAALSATDYDRQGNFRELKQHFMKTIHEYEKNKRIQLYRSN